MANTINTRIINKNDLWSNWESSNLQLKEGEIALAKLTATKTDPIDGHVNEFPIYVMKVGVEGKTFAESPWLYAPASDVHEWAKAETPTDVTFFSDLNNDVTNLKSTVGAGESGLVGKVSELEGKVDVTKVSTAISEAIAALDHTDSGKVSDTTQFVKAVTQADGKVTVTYSKIAATDIDGLTEFITELVGTNVSGLGQAVTNLQADMTKAKSDITSLTTRMGTAESDITTLKDTTIPGVTSRVQTLETVVGTDDTSGLRKTVLEHTTDIANLENKVANVSNVMDFVGAGASLPAVASSQKGDVYVITSGDNAGKEYVFDGTAWVEFGNSTKEQTRFQTIENDIEAIKTKNNSQDTEIGNKLATATYETNRAADLARIEDLETSVDTATTGLKDRMTAAEGDIDKLESRAGTLEGIVGLTDSDGLQKKVADNTAKFAEYYTKEQIEAIEAGIDTEIKKKADATTVDGINTRVETLETTVGDTASGLVNDVATLKNTVGDTTEGLVSQVNANTAKFDEYVKTADFDTKVTSATKVQDHESRLATVESKYISFNGANTGFVVNGSAVEIIFDCGGAQ